MFAEPCAGQPERDEVRVAAPDLDRVAERNSHGASLLLDNFDAQPGHLPRHDGSPGLFRPFRKSRGRALDGRQPVGLEVPGRPEDEVRACVLLRDEVLHVVERDGLQPRDRAEDGVPVLSAGEQEY